MNRLAHLLRFLPDGWDEGLSWIAGLAVTLGLFLAMSTFERTGAPAPVIEELRLVSLPVDLAPLPPRPAEPPPEEAEISPLVGIEAGASDSSLHIRALPPDFESLLPRAPLPPRRLDALGRLPAGLKPRAAVDVDVRRVYQQSEVDQLPKALVRAMPPVKKEHFGDAPSLRVVLLLTIDQQGRVENARVTTPSGSPVFDAIVLATVRKEWEFSPAIRRGKAVRCLAEQPFRINLPGGSPFSLP